MSLNSDSRAPGRSDPQDAPLRQSGRVFPDRLFPGRFLLSRLMGCLEAGRLTLVTPAGQTIEHAASRPGPEAVLVLRNWRALRRMATGGDVGFAEAYMDGDWTTPDLTAVIALAAANGARLERIISGFRGLEWLSRARHLLNANSRTGSRRNISFHYDLGNDFYRLWLDRSMVYSSAIYAVPGQSLEQAQQEKLARIAHLLALESGTRVLEIGCGWGALAADLARRGAHVTGLTLSTEQLAHARAVMAAEGLADQVDLRLQDYRDVDGRFDRIVSIEMVEAVGERYWPAYFGTLRDRLADGGRAVLQAITIAEDRFEHYRRHPDFIQRYIFPGGMLPTKTLIAEHAQRVGLTLVATETFRESYALTLAEWRRRFHAAWPEVEKLGFGPTFRRTWDYYLSYCEAGFRDGVIDVGLYTLKA